jgi:hypothetical protein
MLLRISAGKLDVRRHLGSDKNLSSLKYARLKYKLKSKNRTQKCLWSKNQFFSHFENHRHFENLWKELFNFFKFLSSHIYTKCGKK